MAIDHHISHIVCAVDGSEPSLRAVALAAEIARGLCAKLTVISVRSLHLDRTAVAGVHTPEEVDELLLKASKIALAKGVVSAVTAQLAAKDEASAIVEFARSNGAGMIFVGSTGKGKLARLALGSVSLEVLGSADCPVTVVH